MVGRDLRRAARARAPVLLPRARPRARGADRQPHLVRARAHPDLLAGAHVRADPRCALRRRRARDGAGHGRRRPHPDARRPAPVGRAAEGLVEARRRSASSPPRRGFSGKRSIPWGPHTVHDFLHAKLVVCDDWAFAAPTTTRARARRTPRTCSRSTARRPPTRWPRRSAEFAALYALGPGDSWKTRLPRLRPPPRSPLTRQLDGRRPQLAAELLEHRAAQLRHVHGQRQRVLAQPGEQGRALEHLVDPGAVARDDELVERRARGARGSPRPARGRAVVGVARLLDAAAAEAVRRRSALLVAVLDEAHAVAAAHELLVRVDAGAVAAEPHDEQPDEPRRREVLAQRRGLDAVELLPVLEAERRRDLRCAPRPSRSARRPRRRGVRAGRALEAVAEREHAGARDAAHVRGARLSTRRSVTHPARRAPAPSPAPPQRSRHARLAHRLRRRRRRRDPARAARRRALRGRGDTVVVGLRPGALAATALERLRRRAGRRGAEAARRRRAPAGGPPECGAARPAARRARVRYAEPLRRLHALETAMPDPGRAAAVGPRRDRGRRGLGA